MKGGRDWTLRIFVITSDINDIDVPPSRLVMLVSWSLARLAVQYPSSTMRDFGSIGVHLPA